MKQSSVTKESLDAFRKRKKNPDLFYPIYLGAVAVAVLLLILALVLLKGVLKEYEDAQPKHLAESIFNERFASFDYANFSDEEFDPVSAASLPEFATKEEKLRYLNDSVRGSEISYTKKLGSTDEKITYTVKADKRKLAEFSVVSADQKTEHGFRTYEAGDTVVFCLTPDSPVVTDPVTEPETEPITEPVTEPVILTHTVTVPAGFTVSLNGTALTEDKITDRTFDKTIIEYAPENFPGIEFVTYTFTVTEGEPAELTAVNTEGNAAEITADETGLIHSSPFTFSEGLKNRYSEKLLEITQETGKYMQAALVFDDIAKYYDSSAERYWQLKAIGADAWMVNHYRSVTFENVVASEFWMFPDGTFRGRISCVMIGTRDGATSTDPIDYTFNFRDNNGTVLVTDFRNNL